jgi:hypothetical protein
MERRGLRAGHLVALAGALLALASLWRPWYTLDVPAAFRDALSREGAKVPGLGAFAQGLAAALPDHVSASGWRELEGADVALCVGMAAVVALVLGAAGAFGTAVRVDARAAGRGIAAVGLAGVVVVMVHVVRPPGGGGAASEIVKLGQGIWIALAGVALTLVGGLMAAADDDAFRAPATSAAPLFEPLTPALPPVFDAPAPGRAGRSVPPPGP